MLKVNDMVLIKNDAIWCHVFVGRKEFVNKLAEGSYGKIPCIELCIYTKVARSTLSNDISNDRG